jgi:uncharacterized protein (TIGR00251 family)
MLIKVKVFPQSKKNEIIFISFDQDNQNLFLKVKITKAPEKGKANEAVIKLFSDSWKIAKSEIELIKGATSQNKLFLLKRVNDDLIEFINCQ